MELKIPELSVVVLIGASGSGKSTFARERFRPTEIVSSDACRALICDDETDQSVTPQAFELLHTMMRLRLERRRLVVVDATNVQQDDRATLVKLAREHHALCVAIVLDTDEATCQARNALRAERRFGPQVVRRQQHHLRRSLKHLRREGFRHVYVLRSPEEQAAATITRQPLWTNRTDDLGPFDIISDVHGCFDELCALLTTLGYAVERDALDPELPWRVQPPQGRKAVFVGDLVDRGPRTPDVLRLVMRMVHEGSALCVAGNHDVKLLKALRGQQVQLKHGLAESMEQLATITPEFKSRLCAFLDGLLSHYMLDQGRLCVAHAGLSQALQGRASARVRSFALYGETDGEVDELGLPVRHDWAADYRGDAMVVYGHTPTPEPRWVNKTLCIDTGCVFGGQLTALRYPERELVQTPALARWAKPMRPLLPSAPSPTPQALSHAPDQSPDQSPDQAPAQAPAKAPSREGLLEMEDVRGRLRLTTSLGLTILVREAQSAAALEVMSRFAVDPRWLIYLPPTMSPTATSTRQGLLEHPDEAMQDYREAGVGRVIAQQKHMGSRALLVVTREDEVAQTRFGLEQPSPGVIYTRTGRPFFPNTLDQGDSPDASQTLLRHVRRAMTESGRWEALQTDWVLLDAELMPWSAKAQALLRDQYAAVSAAARHSTAQAQALLRAAQQRGVELGQLPWRMAQRHEDAQDMTQAYRRYCWPVERVEDHRVAPFHVLAWEGQHGLARPHLWHMEQAEALAAADPSGVLMATPHQVVELDDAAQVQALTRWWEELTEAGHEGVVLKPWDGLARDARGRLTQPAIKCRGRSYLRLIYGPEYTQPANLERLRQRGLGRKRALALREFALGHEALTRFTAREPLRRVHECVFALLALETEPLDPRL